MWHGRLGGPTGCGTDGLMEPKDVARAVWETKRMWHGMFEGAKGCGTGGFGIRRMWLERGGDLKDVARAVWETPKMWHGRFGRPKKGARAAWEIQMMWHGLCGGSKGCGTGGWGNSKDVARTVWETQSMWHRVARRCMREAKCLRNGRVTARDDVPRLLQARNVAGTVAQTNDVARASTRDSRFATALRQAQEEVHLF